MTIGIGAGLNGMAQAPFFLQLLLALSWPLLACLLIWNWQVKPPVSAIGTDGKTSGLGRWISNYARRYTPLDGRLARTIGDKPEYSSMLSLWIALIAPLGTLVWLAVPWQGEIYAYQLLGFAFMLPSLAPALACKDLHWRRLLAPGGLRHGGMGLPIFKTTVAIQLMGMSILAGAAILVGLVVFNIPIARSLETVWRYRCFPFEWIFGVSLISVIRPVCAGHPRATIVGVITYALMLLVIGGGMFWAFGWTKGPVLFLADSTFLFSLVFATAALVLLSNRLLTVKKLLPYLRLS